MPSRNPDERALIARIGAHESWARTTDRAARTAPARAASMDRWDREVDPHSELPPAERARRAEHARRAYMSRLSLRSAQSRRKAAEARAASVQLDAAAEAADAEAAQFVGGDAA